MSVWQSYWSFTGCCYLFAPNSSFQCKIEWVHRPNVRGAGSRIITICHETAEALHRKRAGAFAMHLQRLAVDGNWQWQCIHESFLLSHSSIHLFIHHSDGPRSLSSSLASRHSVIIWLRVLLGLWRSINRWSTSRLGLSGLSHSFSLHTHSIIHAYCWPIRIFNVAWIAQWRCDHTLLAANVRYSRGWQFDVSVCQKYAFRSTFPQRMRLCTISWICGGVPCVRAYGLFEVSSWLPICEWSRYRIEKIYHSIHWLILRIARSVCGNSKHWHVS